MTCNDTAETMKTAVYGGSFNPLHIGHLAILKNLTEEAGFDKVYLIVSPKNPLKDNISSASFKDRFNAAVQAIERHFSGCSRDKIMVDDIENHLPEPHYTIHTLEALCRREPENSFTLVIGADNLHDIKRWKEYARILLDWGVAVYPRKGYDILKIREELLKENPAYSINIIDAPLTNISSSEIRDAVARGNDISEWLM